MDNLFESIIDNGDSMMEEFLKQNAPKVVEGEGDQEATKEYLGSKGENHMYILHELTDAGELTDLAVLDQEDNKVFSAKDKGIDINDVRGFIIAASQAVELDLIDFGLVMKYDLLDTKEEEEVEKEEAEDKKEEAEEEDKEDEMPEPEPEEDIAPEEEEAPEPEEAEAMEAMKQIKKKCVESGMEVKLVRVFDSKDKKTSHIVAKASKTGGKPLFIKSMKEAEDHIAEAIKAIDQKKDLDADVNADPALAKDLMEKGEYDVVLRGIADPAEAEKMAKDQGGFSIEDDKEPGKKMVIKAKK